MGAPASRSRRNGTGGRRMAAHVSGQLIRGADGLMRVMPALAAEHVKTFQMTQPLATHWRPASCDEVGCPNYLNGWRVRVEGLDPGLLHLAVSSGRKWTRLDVAAGGSLDWESTRLDSRR